MSSAYDPAKKYTIHEMIAFREHAKAERRARTRAANRDLIYQFVIGLADMQTGPPSGENQVAWYSQRLKQIRTAAREYVHQIEQMQENG